jgi:hypothetical protein
MDAGLGRVVDARQPVRFDRSASDDDRRAGADALDQPAHHTVIEAYAAVRGRCAEYTADVRQPMQRDLSRTTVELLEHVGAGTSASAKGAPISVGRRLIARRLLVEAAWHYQRPPRIGVTLKNRQQGQPDHILQIAWRAQHRLHRVHQRLRERGKHPNLVTVATARELTCFCWAAATAPSPTQPHPRSWDGRRAHSTTGTHESSMGSHHRHARS